MSKYRIITFDGGGIRGLLSAILIKRLNDNFPQLIDSTDLFAGTSTGSFIALGLAYGLSPESLAELYINNGNFIFTPATTGLKTPKYSNKPLIMVLNSIFPENLRLMDLQKHVLVPSFKVNYDYSSRWYPIFYNNFDDSSNSNEKVIDAALSSSSGPGFFPSYQNKIDGGVIANNPSLSAIAFAVDESAGNQNLDELCLLSIGTGYTNIKITADTTKWGLIQWSKYSYPPTPLLDILFDGALTTNALLSSKLLGKNYFRIDPLLSKKVSLDNFSEIPYLIQAAQNADLAPSLQWIEANWF